MSGQWRGAGSPEAARPPRVPGRPSAALVLGVLAPLGYLLAALTGAVCTGHHELHGLALVALGAGAKAYLAVVTSILGYRCLHVVRRLRRYRPAPWVAGPVAVRGGEAGKLRLRLWASMPPRRGPPVGFAR
jgi:hypothetical protein